MTNLIANVDDPLVIAFDGQWGAGKTTFLKMWAGELRKQGYPTIYFDAFENDYVEDAFAALVREVTALIESKEATGTAIAKTLKDKAIGLGRLIGLAGAKIGVKVAVRAATAGLASDKDVASAIAEVTDASGDIVEQYMEKILSEFRGQHIYFSSRLPFGFASRTLRREGAGEVLLLRGDPPGCGERAAGAQAAFDRFGHRFALRPEIARREPVAQHCAPVAEPVAESGDIGQRIVGGALAGEVAGLRSTSASRPPQRPSPPPPG